MPIRQSQIIALMTEARAAHTYGRAIRQQVLAYFARAIAQYPNNKELQEVLTAISYHIQNGQPPDDRCTWLNEQHYSRVARRNDRTRERQELQRRMAGIPTQEEALAALHNRNDARRHAKPTVPFLKIPNDVGEPPLEFDSATPDDLQNEFAMGGGFRLDTTSNPCDHTSSNPSANKRRKR